jgi:Uma2 family endonuclease
MTTVAAVRKPEHIEIDPFALRRFSVGEYHKMIKTGILKPDDRVELLEGWIVNKVPQNRPHSNSVTLANRRLTRILSDRWTLRVQAPITLSDSEPAPDIVLARGAEELYDRRHPRPANICVLMEFGDSTVLEDRFYKGVLYAQERIAEFWLITLVQRRIEVYTKPRGGKYQQIIEYTEKESVPLVLDGVKIADIAVTDLLAKP